MSDGVEKAMLRLFAENRERSISQILLRDFGTPIYGLCLGHADEDAPEDAGVEQDMIDDMERITNVMAVMFSDLKLTTYDAALLISQEIDFLMDDMPALHFHNNDYFDDEDEGIEYDS